MILNLCLKHCVTYADDEYNLCSEAECIDCPVKKEKNTASYADILEECADVARDRGLQYNSPEENYKNIQSILRHSLGLELGLQDIIKVMIATKLSREQHKHKDDNLIDLINYTAILADFIRNSTN